MRLVFDDQALADLEGIFDWIANDNPSAARRVVDRLFSSTELLPASPYMGREGRAPGTREWPVPRLPYVVVYEVHEARDEVVVTAIFHGAQNRDNEG